MGLFNFFKKKQEPLSKDISAEKNIHRANPQPLPDSDEIPSLKSRLNNAFPSENGLYPHEIVMLDYASSYKTTNNKFQNFWKWDYSVLDPQSVLDSLYARGFICISDVSTTLRKLVVADLKTMLSQKNAKVTGKKDELIKRILETYSTEELEEIVPEKYYALTDIGEKELNDNKYISYLHRHHYMSVWEMNILLHTDNPLNLQYRDIIWRELNKQSGIHFQNRDFGLFRNTRLAMHDFPVEENKFKTALHLLCEVISFDLSGLGNGEKPLPNTDSFRKLKYESKMVNLFTTDDEKEVTLPPAIIAYFEKLYNKMGMTADDFIQYTYEQFAEIQIHDRVFTESECANIILSEIDLEKRKIKNSRKVAEQRVKQKLGL